MYILDTDHVSLLQTGHEPLGQRLDIIPKNQLSTTIITYEEQLTGRLAMVRRAKSSEDRIKAHFWLSQTLEFFCRITVRTLDGNAAEIFNELKQAKTRIGTQDLLISAIVLANDGILLTRNSKDFEKVPHLKIEDWSF